MHRVEYLKMPQRTKVLPFSKNKSGGSKRGYGNICLTLKRIRTLRPDTLRNLPKAARSAAGWEKQPGQAGPRMSPQVQKPPPQPDCYLPMCWGKHHHVLLLIYSPRGEFCQKSVLVPRTDDSIPSDLPLDRHLLSEPRNGKRSGFTRPRTAPGKTVDSEHELAQRATPPSTTALASCSTAQPGAVFIQNKCFQ
uniref:Uncharacterized protein n=1 Tax=Rousettus aegyptiacus TaxID=9407 RepID=A0A7J8CIY3_ROUAE|nr:hypothetical protein HJG63_009245 [Rousettus aegyptiacus]